MCIRMHIFFAMHSFIAVLFLTCVTGYEPKDHYYKISMVSSEESPGKPALFVQGRSAVWDVDSQSLFFVDSTEQNVHRLDYASGKIYTKSIGYGHVGVVSLVAGSQRLLVAVRTELYLLDWGVTGDAALRLITAVDLGQPDNYISVGKPDADGRYWAGTKGHQTGDEILPDKGTLYSFEQDSLMRPNIQLKPVTSSGGLAWALNNSMLYFIDARAQRLEAFDYDAFKGEISGRRTIIDVTAYGYEDAYPECVTIDSIGGLWVALTGGGTVLHIDPDKRHVVFGYKLPVSRVTSLAWGGPHMDELFVTSARDTLHEGNEPYAGAIFTIRDTGSKGVAAARFAFDNADRF